MANTTTVPTTEREHYLATFEREYQTTLRVLKAYPANKADWKPTERSNTATQVAWSLVISQMIVEPTLVAPALTPEGLPEPPANWNALVTAFEQAHGNASKKLG